VRFTRRSALTVAVPLGVFIATISLGAPFLFGLAAYLAVFVLALALIMKVRDRRLLFLLGFLIVLAAGFGALQVLVLAHLPFWALLLVLLGMVAFEVRHRRGKDRRKKEA
jgi:uncharacterized membrane protein